MEYNRKIAQWTEELEWNKKSFGTNWTVQDEET